MPWGLCPQCNLPFNNQKIPWLPSGMDGCLPEASITFTLRCMLLTFFLLSRMLKKWHHRQFRCICCWWRSGPPSNASLPERMFPTENGHITGAAPPASVVHHPPHLWPPHIMSLSLAWTAVGMTGSSTHSLSHSSSRCKGSGTHNTLCSNSLVTPPPPPTSQHHSWAVQSLTSWWRWSPCCKPCSLTTWWRRFPCRKPCSQSPALRIAGPHYP